MIPVSLLTDESEQPTHLKRNPLGYVPVLEIHSPNHDPWLLTESTSIIEFLEELHPKPSLFPGDAFNRARIRQLTQIINSDIQPLQNPNVVEKIFSDPKRKIEWNQLWIRNGLNAYQAIAQTTAGTFSVGDTITAADLCLIPQCYNALRNEIQLSEFPLLERIYHDALQLTECKKSSPEAFQPS
jgi:maleylacetoacetate isomerase